MKKILLPSLALAIAAGSASAQTYFSDDFANDLAQWTTADADGDGNEWVASDYSGTSLPQDFIDAGKAAQSNSWTSTDGALTPDNYLVTTSMIDLTSATGNVQLSFMVGNVETTNNWWEENYSVYVTSSNTPATIATATPVHTETLPSGGTMAARNVDLSSFAGQQVYLTFRHHNCTDMNFLVVDDIVVKTPLADDAEMVSVSVAPYVAAGNVSISGVVKNNGANTINSFDLIWDDGSGPNSETVNQTIAPNGTYNFTHGTQLAAVAGTNYNLTVSVALTGDLDSSNDSQSASTLCLSSIPAKINVGEEKTGTWCGWCPRGAVGLAGMESTADFIGIAVHNGDAMVVTAYDAGIGTYIPGGYPGAGVDRIIDGDPSTFAQMHADRSSAIVPCKVNSITATLNGAQTAVDISTEVEFFGPAAGEYRLSAVITEDDIMTGGDQANYYAGGGSGSLVDPVNGHDWANLSDPASPADFGGYDHTARALVGPIEGIQGSLPAQVAASTYDYDFATTNLVNGQDVSKSHVVVMIISQATGEILNAMSTDLGPGNVTEEAAAFGVEMFPNPTNANTNILVEVSELSDVEIRVTNNLGQVVYTESQANAFGTQQITLDGAAMEAGIYHVSIKVGNNVVTKTLSVVK